jgi:hypothetical protein
LAGVSGGGLSSFRKNDSLNEGVQGCRLSRHALSQSRLQAISEEVKRLGFARAHALKSGCQGRHEDRAEEQCVLGGQCFPVSVPFVIGPCSIRKRGGLELFDRQMLELPVPFEWSQQFGFPPGLSPERHAGAVLGTQGAIGKHLCKHGIGLVHNRLKSSDSVVCECWKHNDQASAGAQFPCP